MTTKKMLPFIIINLFGIILGIAANAYVALSGELSAVQYVNLWINVAALAAALVYLIMGFRKSASAFYKIFASFFGISLFVCVLSLAMGDNYVGLSCYTVLFALILMLALVKDMGKKKTFILCGICLGVGIVLLVQNFFTVPSGAAAVGNWLFQIVINFSVIVMTAIMWLMAAAKYADKLSRKGFTE